MKKIRNIIFAIIATLILCTLGYMFYINAEKPLVIEKEYIKAFEMDELLMGLYNDDLMNRPEEILYKKSGLKKLDDKKLSDYVKIVFHYKIKNRSLFDIHGIKAKILNGKEINSVLMQSKLIAYDSVESKKVQNRAYVASVLMYRKGMTDKELKKEVDKIKLRIYWSSQFFEGKSFDICVGDMDYKIVKVK